MILGFFPRPALPGLYSSWLQLLLVLGAFCFASRKINASFFGSYTCLCHNATSTPHLQMRWHASAQFLPFSNLFASHHSGTSWTLSHLPILVQKSTGLLYVFHKLFASGLCLMVNSLYVFWGSPVSIDMDTPTVPPGWHSWAVFLLLDLLVFILSMHFSQN